MTRNAATVTIRANFKLPGATGYRTEDVTIARSTQAETIDALVEEGNAMEAALEAKYGTGIIHGDASYIR